jgi:hypothetical protein
MYRIRLIRIRCQWRYYDKNRSHEARNKVCKSHLDLLFGKPLNSSPLRRKVLGICEECWRFSIRRPCMRICTRKKGVWVEIGVGRKEKFCLSDRFWEIDNAKNRGRLAQAAEPAQGHDHVMLTRNNLFPSQRIYPWRRPLQKKNIHPAKCEIHTTSSSWSISPRPATRASRSLRRKNM